MRLGTYLRLGERTNGKDRPGELILGQRKQEVRLVLVRIETSPEEESSVLRLLDTRVVPSCQMLGPEPSRAVQERRELHIAVAVRAGNWRAPRAVLAHEIRDHRVRELPLEVHDVVGETACRGYAPRIVQVVERAAATELHTLTRLPRASRGVQLHRQTNDVMTLLGEQGRGNRRVDAARHGNDNAH